MDIQALLGAITGLFGNSNTTTVAKNVPPPGGTSTFAKGLQGPITNPDAPMDNLAEAIGPWETTVTPAGAEAATGEKTFGDKLSEALSGLGALETPKMTPPDPSDSLAIARLLLNAAPPSALPSLAAALPRRR